MTEQMRHAPDAPANPAWTYEMEAVPRLFGPWAPHVIEVVSPRPGERVLDVGCGTGIVARRIAPIVGPTGKVVGIDPSPNMLSVAQEVALREGLDIEWHQGRAEELPFPDSSFDVVTAQFVLMFFTDRQAGLRECRRVLTNGGRAAVAVWQPIDRHPIMEALHLVLERRVGTAALTTPFSLGEPEVLRDLLTDAGFRNIDIREMSKIHRFAEPHKFVADAIATAAAAIPAMQAFTPDERHGLVDSVYSDLKDSLHRATDNNQVVQEWHALIARADR